MTDSARSWFVSRPLEGGRFRHILAVHVQPGAGRSEIAGIHGDALKVRIAARAVEGEANAELCRFLGALFGVPRKSVVLKHGGRSRRKVVEIESPEPVPEALLGGEEAR